MEIFTILLGKPCKEQHFSLVYDSFFYSKSIEYVFDHHTLLYCHDLPFHE